MSEETGFLVGFFGALSVIIILALIWYIFQLIAGWKVYVKMGEPGWKSIIPFYCGYVLYSHIWNGVWYFGFLACNVIAYFINQTSMDGMLGTLIALIGGVISVVGFVIQLIQCKRLSECFGHGTGFTIGLFFLRPIFYLILGFGSSEYQGDYQE